MSFEFLAKIEHELEQDNGDLSMVLDWIRDEMKRLEVIGIPCRRCGTLTSNEDGYCSLVCLNWSCC